MHLFLFDILFSIYFLDQLVVLHVSVYSFLLISILLYGWLTTFYLFIHLLVIR